VARLAVLASGRGTNFQAIVERLRAPRDAQALDGMEGGAFRDPSGATVRDGGAAGGHGGGNVRRVERHHDCVLLVHDRKDAMAAARARELGVPSVHVSYSGRTREEAEASIDAALRASGADLVALAGFMRILSPAFVARWKGRLVNVHPSLLPLWPGAEAIHRAYEAGESRFGVTVHFVDEGMDTGPIIAQDEFEVKQGEAEAEVEERIHRLEHALYPKVVLDLLDRIDSEVSA
jgi:phosphoribosylglycinamide formyltransferase-1